MPGYGLGGYGLGQYGIGQIDGQSDGHSSASGALTEAEAVTGTSSGHASVSGTLTVKRVLAGASAGSGGASGLIGLIRDMDGSSGGHATVAGDLIVGVAQSMEGASHGGSYAGERPYYGGLQVKKYTEISGEQTGDYDGASGDLPPMGGDRGLTRGHFTPRSTGRTSSKRPGS